MRKYFLLITGILLLITAIIEQQIDHENYKEWNWIISVILGLGFILTYFVFFPEKAKGLSGALSKFASVILRLSTPTALISLAAIAFVILVYVWFAQPNDKDGYGGYNYYSELAIAFRAGHLYLAEAPSPALLELNNPYDYLLRKQLNIEDFPWDVSLYDNKFYMYWGPAPSLILSIFGNEQLSHIGDHYVALAFVCGLFLYSVLIFNSVRRRSLPLVPNWAFGVLLMAMGLSTPITIMLKDARVYEAAIFGCQFFFIGGCYWIYSSIRDKELVLWKLVLGSFHWAFALGTRITILPVIFFSVVGTVIYIVKTFRPLTLKAYLPILAALGLPLLLAIFGLSWYNQARFDSIFEFGIKYQLTNVDYRVFKESFSGKYIKGNIYNYFVHPFNLRPQFPYIVRVEYLPSNDRLAGLIYLSPYILLIFAPLISISKSFQVASISLVMQEEKDTSENWLTIIFAGSALIAMFTILTFYFVTMRYMEDFMPSLMLLITIQLGRELHLLGRHKLSWKILASTTIALALITISANLLVAIPSSGTEFLVGLMNSASKLLGIQ